MNKLDLSNKTPRRIGLTRTRPSPTKSPPTPTTGDEMPSKTKKATPPAAASKTTSDEDIERSPEEGDSTDEEAIRKRTQPQPTNFAKREPTPATVNGTRTQGQENGKANGILKANSLGIQPGKQQSSQSSRQSSRESSSPAKRKSQTERIFGESQKKAKVSYGRSAGPARSSASAKLSSSAKSKDNDGSTAPKFQSKNLDPISDSEGSAKSDKENKDKHEGSGSDVPTKTEKKKEFKNPIDISPVKKDKTPKAKFKIPGGSDDELGSSSPVSKPPRKLKGKIPKSEPPLTQKPIFNPMDGLVDLGGVEVDELAGDDKPLFSDDEFEFPIFKRPASEIGDTPPGSQQPRCPFCKQEVDPAVLKKFEGMSTREQEKFCQTHQKEDAKREWDKLDYPKINWTSLDSRINKHHKLVKKLINGMDSHYRAEFQARVDAGQDRNLRKATTNLTPGYYGGRGLRVLSENIMNEHSKLLKKRAPLDTLMSARGVTAFAQSVLVPEVAVLLIKEDMRISVDEARKLLEDSARIGELVHEEIREIVTRGPEHDVDEFSE